MNIEGVSAIYNSFHIMFIPDASYQGTVLISRFNPEKWVERTRAQLVAYIILDMGNLNYL